MTGRPSGWRGLFENQVVQGFVKMSGGTSAAQLILIAASPILTRLYSPEDFGVLAIFMALSAIGIAVAAGRFELAVMLPDKEDEATLVAALALVLTCASSSVLLITAIVSYPLLIAPQGWAIGAWVFLVPPTVLAGGMSAVFVAAATRRGDFGLIGTAAALRNTVSAGVQILLGLISLAPGGLLVGGFLSFGAANVRLGRPVLRGIQESRPTRDEMVGAARRYARFPMFTLPAGLLNSLYLQGTPLLIGGVFGSAVLGIWSLAHRIISLPLAFVGGAAAESYYRAATAARSNRKAALRLFDRTVLGLAALSVLPMAILAIWGPDLFGLVFGDEWAEAGQYARLMIPLAAARFLTSPVARTFIVYGRNQLSIWVQVLLLCVLLGATGAAVSAGWSFSEFLLAYSVAGAVAYGLVLIWARQIIRTASGGPGTVQA